MKNHYGEDYEKTKVINFIKKVALWCIPVICILIVIAMYNGLVSLHEDVKLAESNVENMMQRRLDLIPDLVETVKAYSNHEEAVFGKIADARAALTKASDALEESLKSGDKDEITKANNEVTKQIENFTYVSVENYPELESGEQYTSLMDNLEGSVNRISVAREEYNQVVNKYNVKIKKIPGCIFAKLFGFESVEPFTADEDASKTNLVNMGEN